MINNYQRISSLALGFALVAFSAPASSKDEASSSSEMPDLSDSVFAGDWVTLGLGVGYAPSYDGSDNYSVIPAPLLQGSISGFEFGARGPGLYVDVISDTNSDSKVKFLFGPQVRVRLDRNSGIKDPVVKLLGKRDAAVELGFTSGISFTGLTNPFDRLTFGVDAAWDVAGAHDGRVISPSISFSSPLSRSAFANLSVSATHVDDNYADTYFTVDPAGSLASGLPTFAASGGWKNVGISALGGVDLSGNALDGGWSIFALTSYSKLVEDAKRSPVTSIRGDAGQWFVAAGVAYTF